MGFPVSMHTFNSKLLLLRRRRRWDERVIVYLYDIYTCVYVSACAHISQNRTSELHEIFCATRHNVSVVFFQPVSHLRVCNWRRSFVDADGVSVDFIIEQMIQCH